MKSIKSSLAALALGAFALSVVPAARAQITFTVDEFTADILRITLNPGTLRTTDLALFDDRLTLVDGLGTNATWINSNFDGSGGGAFGSSNFFLSFADSGGAVDYVSFVWSGNLSSAGNLVTGMSFTFSGTGLFTPANVSQWALYWGNPLFPPATLQSSGSAVTGGGSAPIPEPSSYASLAGLAALGLVASRRRASRR